MNNESNYRYILIDTPEKKQKYSPKQKDDQVSLTGTYIWQSVSGNENDTDFYDSFTYRRPITPPAGYEIVPEAEARMFDGSFQNDVIVYMGTNGWCKMSTPKWNGIDTFCRKINNDLIAAIEKEMQTKITPLKENYWHRIDDLRELPDDRTDLEFIKLGRREISVGLASYLRTYYKDCRYTHWRLHIPPPEKVVDEVEECFQGWVSDAKSGINLRDAIRFALNWAKEHGGKK